VQRWLCAFRIIDNQSAPPESVLCRIRGWSGIVRGTNLRDLGIFHPIRDYMDLLQPLRGISIKDRVDSEFEIFCKRIDCSGLRYFDWADS